MPEVTFTHAWCGARMGGSLVQNVSEAHLSTATGTAARALPKPKSQVPNLVISRHLAMWHMPLSNSGIYT